MRRTGSREKWRSLARTRHAIAALGLLLPQLAGAAPALVPEYQVGETARVDVVAPAELVAIDPVTAAALRLKEAQKIPAVYRFDSNVLHQVVTGFTASWATYREGFLASLTAAYSEQPLNSHEVSAPQFARFVASHRQAYKGFPLTTNLAARWAQRASDADLVAQYESLLRAAMQGYIRSEPVTPAERIGGQRVRLLMPSEARLSDLSTVESSGTLIAKSNLVGLSEARFDLQKALASEDRAVGSYTAEFLQPNCLYEARLTKQFRARKTDAIWSANRHEPGQFLVRSGEVVTTKTKAALDRLRAEVAAAQFREPIPSAPPPSPWPHVLGWAGASLGAAALLGLAIARRRAARETALPVRWSQAQPPTHLPATAAELANPDRSLLMAQMARWLSHSLVQRLFWQRRHLLENQKAATAQAHELEQRLAKVQEQTQTRFRIYEERIAQLEKELAAAEEEKRDLIRAKFGLARQELEAVQTSHRLKLN